MFEVSSHTAVPTQTVTAFVSARNFRQVTSAQFSLRWDPAVLQFASVSNFGIRGLSRANFGATAAHNGSLAFAWDDPQIAGVTAEDGAALFSVTFDVISGSGGVSPIAFSDSPTASKVGVNFAVAAFAGQDGEVQVAGAPAPKLVAADYSRGTFRFSVPTAAGQRYILEFADSIPGANWTPLSTITGDGAIKILSDVNATNQQRYYRVRVE
jgi:hypothetical protein